MLFEAGDDGQNYTTIMLEADDHLEIAEAVHGSGYVYRLETARVFQDCSAWYHVVIAFDSTQTEVPVIATTASFNFTDLHFETVK